jgi:hypothetical protein
MGPKFAGEPPTNSMFVLIKTDFICLAARRLDKKINIMQKRKKNYKMPSSMKTLNIIETKTYTKRKFRSILQACIRKQTLGHDLPLILTLYSRVKIPRDVAHRYVDLLGLMAQKQCLHISLQSVI